MPQLLILIFGTLQVSTNSDELFEIVTLEKTYSRKLREAYPNIKIT